MAVVVLRQANKISVLLVVCLLLVIMPSIGEANRPQALGDWFERSLGNSAVPELVKQYGGVYIVPVHERIWLDEVFQRLVDVAEREELEYNLTVLNSREYNAFALPGGYLFITRGLLKAIDSNEAKLAAVLGHEIAHVEKKHGVNAVLRQMGMAVLIEVGALWLDVFPGDLLRVASATLLQLIQLGWGREAEYEADVVGQNLAHAAGFDPIGAVALLDDLLIADSSDLPMKVFRTHPDTISRRKRVEERLGTFWPIPQPVSSDRTKEILALGRSYDQNGRTDPNNRYVLALDDFGSLTVYDGQRELEVKWLENIEVLDFSWSPEGGYLATAVSQNDQGEIWFLDRFGHIVKKFTPQINGIITKVTWSLEGKMLALEFDDGERTKVYVTYFETEVYIPVSGDRGGENPIWNSNKLYFSVGSTLYFTTIPKVQPVTVSQPLPVVLQRQRVLSPTVIREGDTIRLTRPSLVLP